MSIETRDQATEVRMFGPEMHEDPYAAYGRLLRKQPVFRDETLKAWIVTRHADVVAGFKDRRLSSTGRTDLSRRRYSDPSLGPLFDTLDNNLTNNDDPVHSRLRKLVHFAFQRAEIVRYEPLIRDRVDGLIDAGLARGRMDFVHDFAVPLPIMVISAIVGIPEEDREQVKTWCDDYSFVAINHYTEISEERLLRALNSVLAFKAYLKDKADGHRRAPADNLLSHLVRVEEEDGGRLSLDELLSNVLLLLNAGNETTTGLLANGLLALLRNPDQLAQLRAEPSLIPSAVEEFLRYDPPVQFMGRIAAEDLELGGQEIAKGDLVLLVIGASGRDSSAFEGAEGLDVTRERNRHVAFGHGPHICSGMQLARLEARIAFERLFERLSTLELEPGEIRHHPNIALRCPEHLWIRVAG